MKVLAIVFLFSTLNGNAPPDTLTLDYCYQQAYKNYPKAKNIELQQKITALNVDIAHTGYYPQIDVNGKASYQSEVTRISFPGGGSPEISKDQYEAAVSVNQNIFNGGVTGIRKKLEQAKGKQEINNIKVELHQIRAQIDQVYFGILLSQKQSENIQLLSENLREQLVTIRSKVENGVLLPSQQYILQAEILKNQQDSTDVQSNIKAGYSVLGELIGEGIEPGTSLALPDPEMDYQFQEPERPEYDLFESTRNTLGKQLKLSESKKWPVISAFGTAAYGRPGFNFLNDDFHDYYIIGIQMKWSVWDYLNSGHEAEIIKVQQQKVNQNEMAFTSQLNASLSRIQERIISIRKKIERDEEVIELREKIVEESSSQLQNGVITATEYVTELTRANQATLSLYINRVNLSQAVTDYLTMIGKNPEEISTN